MKMKERIEELERRVRELESKPLHVVGVPLYVPAPPVTPFQPVWPQIAPLPYNPGPRVHPAYPITVCGAGTGTLS